MKILFTDPCPCGSGKTFGDCHDLMRRQQLTPDANLIHVPLQVVVEPDPGTRAVFERGGEGTVFLSGIDGRTSLDCGNCGAALAVRIDRDQIRGIVLKCAKCGVYNAT